MKRNACSGIGYNLQHIAGATDTATSVRAANAVPGLYCPLRYLHGFRLGPITGSRESYASILRIEMGRACRIVHRVLDTDVELEHHGESLIGVIVALEDHNIILLGTITLVECHRGIVSLFRADKRMCMNSMDKTSDITPMAILPAHNDPKRRACSI